MAQAARGEQKSGWKNKAKPHDSHEVQLSKCLSWVLRHGVNSVGLTFLPGGFLYVSDVLKLPRFSKFTLEEVRSVVANNDKQRFTLETDPDNGQLKIRANQGHSVQVEDLQLTPLTDSTEYPLIIHGTYLQAWRSIKSQGLRKMKRNHIHFAVGEPGEDGVVSGMRKSCDVMIYVDVAKALAAGVKFFKSANNVILSPGTDDGVIPPCFFSQVIDRSTGAELPLGDDADPGAHSGKVGAVTADDVADEMEMSRKQRRKKKKHKKSETD
ncbi:tRNA 2'-phosphotransferase 1-like [Haliotis rufescens]|uniref:tRNA 2'-phosphotransferase 1-like n=1 Tax=Haliotis rufescens TaxID=6454 RepID=UPI00201F2E2F|nr:tRNA 2'-phosphotransferase 1-like [Haliotis rufescens]XP_048259224.1 tRNA 2'-phosphotransferase 1-like [Haliotis rufescens]